MSDSVRTDADEAHRSALVVAVAQYADPLLRQLRAPAEDAAELGRVLSDPELGGFTVTTVADRPAQEVRIVVDEFLSEQRPGDLCLVYLSCHGLVDARRRLYFAATDTRKERLVATAIEARWLLDQLDECRARRQIVILDCCFSGAFAGGTKGDDDVGIGDRLLGDGRGRVVLTASRATEYSFEGEGTAKGAPTASAFTHALVTGIRTGAADHDDDGWITIDDAYAYAFEEMRAAGADQTPQRWLYGAEGGIVLARNPAATEIRPEPPQASAAAILSPTPGAPVPPSWRRGRRLYGILAAAAMIVAAAGIVGFLQLGSSPEESQFSFDGTTVETVGPWRLTIFDNIQDANDRGCRIKVTDLDHGGTITVPSHVVYGTSQWQMQSVGSFRLEGTRAQCEPNAEDGAGDEGLPVFVEQGDSDGFNPSGTFQVEVADDDFAAPECAVILRDGETGNQVDKVTVTPDQPVGELEPGDRSSLYLSDVPCPVTVTED